MPAHRKFDWEKAREMYRSGMSCGDIGALVGVMEGTVWEALRLLGEPRRSFSEAQQMRRARKPSQKSIDRVKALAAKHEAKLAKIAERERLKAMEPIYRAERAGRPVTRLSQSSRPRTRPYREAKRLTPLWVPKELRDDYRHLARTFGEERAASEVRRMKAEAARC